MAKPTAPLLSFGASGQIGKTMVYGSWRGRPYVRRHVIPSNPQSAEQTTTRSAFSFLQSVYKFAPSLVTDVWTAYARGKAMTPRNAFTKGSLGLIRPETDLDLLVISGGAGGGPPPTAVVATPGADSISCAISVPATVPEGWTIYSAVAAAIPDQNPQTGVLFPITAGEDLTAAYVVVLSGLDEVLHQVRAWLKWTKPDGTFAYSPEVSDTATPT